MKRKIIFLDIDGVLQPFESKERFANIVHGDGRKTCNPELYKHLESYLEIDFRAAIDDRPLTELGKHFVQTDSSIREEHAVKCLKLLK